MSGVEWQVTGETDLQSLVHKKYFSTFTEIFTDKMIRPVLSLESYRLQVISGLPSILPDSL